MIVFDLLCGGGAHRFEGWFASSADFASQLADGLLCCPQCGSADVTKAPMAPAVPRKAGQREMAATALSGPMPAELRQVMARLAAMQTDALKSSTWVGADFAEESRAMHYGERDVAPIHGQASADEARSLLDEGINVMPLPFPVGPPEELN